MKPVKKTLAWAMALSMILACCATAAAQDDAPPLIAPSPQEDTPMITPENVRVYGTVSFLEDGRLFVQTESTAAAIDQIILGVGQHTRIIDATTCAPMALEDIEEGSFIYAWADPVMLLSMPPQAGVQLIVANIPQDAAAPLYHTVLTCQVDEEGTASILTDKGDLLEITGQCNIFPYLTRNIVTVHSLVPGTQILVWQENTAPEGQASNYVVDRVMVFPYGYQGWLEVEQGAAALSGAAVDFAGAQAYTGQDGILMLPMRAICEAAGWEVSWDDQARTAIAAKGDTTLRFTIGSAQASGSQDDQGIYLAAQPYISGGRTMVAATDLARLLDVFYFAQ